MVITYFGKQFLKLQLGDVVIAVNPVSKDSKLSGAKFGADVCLVSVNHPDYNGTEEASHGEKKPLVLNSPGEYEVKGIFIKGLSSETEISGKKYINTIYTLSLDNINICILGALSGKDLPKETKEAIDSVDIIFSPAGLSGLSPRDAYNLASSFEPKVIIPTDFDQTTLKTFLKEAGGDEETLDKYTVKKKDLEGKDGDIVVLKSSA